MYALSTGISRVPRVTATRLSIRTPKCHTRHLFRHSICLAPIIIGPYFGRQPAVRCTHNTRHLCGYHSFLTQRTIWVGVANAGGGVPVRSAVSEAAGDEAGRGGGARGGHGTAAAAAGGAVDAAAELAGVWVAWAGMLPVRYGGPCRPGDGLHGRGKRSKWVG